MVKRRKNAGAVARGRRRARGGYRLTARVQRAQELVRGQIRELYDVVVEGSRKGAKL